MSADREARIRQRAHAIWVKEGRPDGRHEEHWHRASREIDGEEQDGEAPRETPRRAAHGKATAPTPAVRRRRSPPARKN